MTDYQKFQLQWMIDHSYSLDDLMKELDRCQMDWAEGKEPVSEIFKSWELDIGFGGSIWPCEKEWQQCDC